MSVSTAEVRMFSCQFSAMIGSGESLVRALVTLAEQQPNAEFGRVIKQVQEDVTGDGHNGATLSEAMSKYPSVFGPEYIEAVSKGEASGNLDTALQQICTN